MKHLHKIIQQSAKWTVNLTDKSQEWCFVRFNHMGQKICSSIRHLIQCKVIFGKWAFWVWRTEDNENYENAQSSSQWKRKPSIVFQVQPVWARPSQWRDHTTNQQMKREFQIILATDVELKWSGVSSWKLSWLARPSPPQWEVLTTCCFCQRPSEHTRDALATIGNCRLPRWCFLIIWW